MKKSAEGLQLLCLKFPLTPSFWGSSKRLGDGLFSCADKGNFRLPEGQWRKPRAGRFLFGEQLTTARDLTLKPYCISQQDTDLHIQPRLHLALRQYVKIVESKPRPVMSCYWTVPRKCWPCCDKSVWTEGMSRKDSGLFATFWSKVVMFPQLNC